MCHVTVPRRYDAKPGKPVTTQHIILADSTLKWKDTQVIQYFKREVVLGLSFVFTAT